MKDGQSEGSDDHLERAGTLFLVIWSLVLVALVTFVVGASLRGWLVADLRPGIVESLGVTDLSIVPSGRPPRHPPPPAVDLRHSPRLPEAP